MKKTLSLIAMIGFTLLAACTKPAEEAPVDNSIQYEVQTTEQPNVRFNIEPANASDGSVYYVITDKVTNCTYLSAGSGLARISDVKYTDGTC